MKKETIGSRLRHVRERSGYSQKEVSALTGITNVNISRYELDQTSPTLETIRKLAELYQVSLDYIFMVTDKPDRIKPGELSDYDVQWVKVVKSAASAGLSPETLQQIIDAIKKHES